MIFCFLFYFCQKGNLLIFTSLAAHFPHLARFITYFTYFLLILHLLLSKHNFASRKRPGKKSNNIFFIDLTGAKLPKQIIMP